VGWDLSGLSVAEIERRFARGGEPVSPQLLARLGRDPRRGVRRVYALLRRRHERERKERLRLDALLNFERVLWKSGLTRVAGVDEAGTGPLAGPVVAAAVVFPPGTSISGVDDSKKIDPERRRELASAIRKHASGVGVGEASVQEIDTLNIYRAALLAMRRAVEALPEPPQHVLVDARTIPELSVPQNPFCKGDGINFSIAAASIIAKTHRDALMERLDEEHPGYGFARHKGYGTAAHQRAIRDRGPSPAHRMSFPVLREVCGEFSPEFYALRGRLLRAHSRAPLAAFEKALDGARSALPEHEHRKLRLLLSRRWKALEPR
jgi:ribonuclease HII